MSIAKEAIKHLQEEFGIEVNEEIVCRGLCRQSLHAQVKEKKTNINCDRIVFGSLCMPVLGYGNLNFISNQFHMPRQPNCYLLLFPGDNIQFE